MEAIVEDLFHLRLVQEVVSDGEGEHRASRPADVDGTVNEECTESLENSEDSGTTHCA